MKTKDAESRVSHVSRVSRVSRVSEEVFAYPTDTLWGLGGNMYSRAVAEKIHAIKKQTSPRPFSLAFAELDHIFNYFHFPREMDRNWLAHFFSLESSLGVLRKWGIKKIPPWISLEGPYVIFRLQPHRAVSKITQRVGAPIISTSLNLAGQAPLSKRDDILLFIKNAPVPIELVEDELTPQNASSTIFIYEGNGQGHFLRSGRLVDQVKAHVRSLK